MDAATRIAERLSALAAMGFRREDASPIPEEVIPVSGNRYRVSGARSSMGTLVSVVALHPSADLARAALSRAFAEMDRVVGLLNRYDPSSAVSYLNDTGRIQAPPGELTTVVRRALAFHRVTGGLFDPTVKPIIDLLRPRRKGPSLPSEAPRLPEPSEIRDLLPLVNAEAVAVGTRAIRFDREGMGITLDGIAKGYAVDRMAEVLAEAGLRNFLVNAGGDIRCAGLREDGAPWRVAVQDPERAGRFPDVIAVTNGAVATSGSYEVSFDPDRKHHHIVRAGDGSSPQEVLSVSVVAPTAMEADALATSVFLMGPVRGTAFVESIPDCACLIVDRGGRRHRSRRWTSAAAPPNPEAETL